MERSLRLINPGKLNRNGPVELFNDRSRDEPHTQDKTGFPCCYMPHRPSRSGAGSDARPLSRGRMGLKPDKQKAAKYGRLGDPQFME